MDSQNSLAPDIDKNYEVLKSYENIQLSSVNNASLRDDKSNAIKSDMYITPVLDKESPQSRGIELIEKSPAEHHSRNPDTIIGGYLSFPSANKVGRENTFVDIASSASKVNTYEKLNKSTADTRDDEVYATINNENVLDSENSNAATSNRHKPYERTRQNDGNGQRRKCGKRIFVVGLVVILVLITISSVATTIFVFTSKDQGKFTTENDVTSVESSNTGLTNSIPTKPFSTSIPTTSTTKLAPEHTVAFENSLYMFNIGEKESITCGVQNMPDWK
ncbi:uncharacterized protein LOC128552066 isoform X2 [Mercenaria mercenaria]|uniref:uncharacterized protein LOC128552066 isoform X2 n=1 Tax=Mercenaria mercenaria TaxID=6596 RepID=UPI00234E8B68|nr:uncharacterized protein LOC128552066 isoform X2 [Mercenaria mercenaria]